MIKTHIYTIKNGEHDEAHHETKDQLVTKSDKSIIDNYKGSSDYMFMDNCRKVDEKRPVTWAKYPNTISGANEIISMEYNELMANAKAGDLKSWETNLYHLSVALLHAWRIYNGNK